MSDVVNLGNVPVGDGHPTVFVAEIGSFFKQDLDRAMDFLRRIVEAGAPVFKTEILHDPDIVLNGTGLNCNFHHAGGTHSQDYRALIEERVMPLKDYEKLFSACEKFNVPAIASVFDFKGVDFLKEVGGAGVKLSRNYINHEPLLRYAAESGMPVILDMGHIYLSEMMAAVELVRSIGAPLIINHHPGANPSTALQHNLRMIETYKQVADVPVGLSCHYRGDLMLYLATALGANLLEKGVVDDPEAAESDIVSAASFQELKDMIGKVRESWEAIGDGRDRTKGERDLSTRSGMVAASDMQVGSELALSDVKFAWPPKGIAPDLWPLVAGSNLQFPAVAGEPITWRHFGLKGADFDGDAND